MVGVRSHATRTNISQHVYQKDKCGLKQAKTRRSTEYQNIKHEHVTNEWRNNRRFPTLHPAHSCKNWTLPNIAASSIQHPKCPISLGRFWLISAPMKPPHIAAIDGGLGSGYCAVPSNQLLVSQFKFHTSLLLMYRSGSWKYNNSVNPNEIMNQLWAKK